MSSITMFQLELEPTLVGAVSSPAEALHHSIHIFFSYRSFRRLEITDSARLGRSGISHRKSTVPGSTKQLSAMTPEYRRPYTRERFAAERASVTAGLANDVEAVNQYAAMMYAATARQSHLSAGANNPNHATNQTSPQTREQLPQPARACCEAK